MRCFVLSCALILVVATCGACFGQGAPGCYPATYPAFQRCCPCPQEAPITRRVEVEVPVPCAPVMCAPPTVCAPPNMCIPAGPYPCCRPCPAPPTCEPRPVRIKIDVRVRPEMCGAMPPPQQECLDLGPLRPVVGLLAATMAAPVQILESMFPGSVSCAPIKIFRALPQFASGCTMPSVYPVSCGPPPCAYPPITKCAPPYAYGCIQGTTCPPQRVAHRPIYRRQAHARRDGLYRSQGSQFSVRGGDVR